MSERFCPPHEKLRRYQAGPLGAHIQSYADLLYRQGYTSEAGWGKIRLLREFGRWLDRHHVTIEALDEQQVAVFLEARFKRVARRQGEKATLALLLKHLRQNHIIPTPLAKAVQSPTELIAQDYHQYLLHERSLGEETSKGYIGIIRRFLLNRFPNQKVELKKLHTKDIGEFVLHNTTRQGRRACHNTQLPHCAVSFAFSFKKGKPLQTWQWLSPQ